MLALRALALLTALLVAWPATAIGGYQVTCRMMGRVAKKCCCAPSRDHAQPSSAQAEARSRSCCEVSPSGDHATLPGLRGSELRLDAPVLATVAPVLDAPAPSGRPLSRARLTARAPPPRAAPLFITNCSLLS